MIRLSHLIDDIWARHAAAIGAREEEWAARERRQTAARLRSLWAAFIASAGRRFARASFDNFDAVRDDQASVVAALRNYADELPERVSAGQGVILFGTTGAGKDHLLVALAREAICRHGVEVQYVNGATLYRRLRDAMERGSESHVLRPLQQAAVLVLSDALPPIGSLTAWQSQALYELIDARWTARKPIWATLNVKNAEEAAERMGAALLTRLHDGALVLRCIWPSHRRPELVACAPD